MHPYVHTYKQLHFIHTHIYFQALLGKAQILESQHKICPKIAEV